MAFEQDQQIADVVTREQSRLRDFIRRRVPDPRDAEDVLQDVFYKLVEANRLLMPIEHVTGWLFRVARNRITDLFRKKRAASRRPFASSDYIHRPPRSTPSTVTSTTGVTPGDPAIVNA
jgi:RNA polymerase sigma factor (sigma-70 family)